jgi:hypothetical protein
MKDKIDIERMKNESIIVHCKTEQQFNNIIKSFKINTNRYNWDTFKENTYIRCYYNDLVYGNINWFDITSTPYEEILIKEKEQSCNINFRRQIIKQFFENGKIATIHFKKKNGEERIMNCRIKRVKEEFRKSNNKKSSNETMTFWEISKQQYRSVRLGSIISISGRKEKIYFEFI